MTENNDNLKENSEGIKKNFPGQAYEIPFEGSLGLLALGAVGLKAWRNKRKEIINNKLKKEESE